jgi:bifunctional enzyme CysN/CysC
MCRPNHGRGDNDENPGMHRMTHAMKRPFHFIVCGSVDAGQKELVNQLFAQYGADNQHAGALDEGFDFAPLIKILTTEQEPGSASELAYQFRCDGLQQFTVLDAWQGDQYINNLVSGVPAIDFAVIAIDACKGVVPQVLSQIYLLSFVGVRHIVVVINKMDLAGYAEKTYQAIAQGVLEFGQKAGHSEVTIIPVSAIKGDNISKTSEKMSWYQGATLADTLMSIATVDSGNAVSANDTSAGVSNQFETTLIWMAEEAMLPGRQYVLKAGANTSQAEIGQLKFKINTSTMDRLAATTLMRDEIGKCTISLDRPIAFSPYKENKDAGSFTLFDKISKRPVAIGMLDFALRRASNIQLQALDINKAMRAGAKHQKPCILWFTGLSASGKSTIANRVEKLLHEKGSHTYLLDGDNVRHGLNKDLGFTDADRVENIRRIGEMAKLMVDAGLIVLTAFISPFRAERRMARGLVHEDEFIEVFVNTPLSVAEQRDPKGLYKKARRGELKNFTGIDSAYEAPENPELVIDTTQMDPDQAARLIVDRLVAVGIVKMYGTPRPQAGEGQGV